MPEIDEDVWDGFAGADVDELDVDIHVYTVIVLPDIPTHIFAIDV